MIVTLTHFTPPARADGIPWTNARIEESATETGTYAVLATIALNPVDADPADPQPRDFTVEGTIASGWYRIVFLDATLNESSPTDPIQNVASGRESIRPSARDLGSLMRARTKDRFGNLVGTFNDDTRPTREQAEDMIDMAVDLLPINPAIVPDRLHGRAKRVVLLLAAQLVEAQYFPEQADSDQSAASLYGTLYTAALASLQSGLEENEPGTVPPRWGTITALGGNGIVPTPANTPVQPWENSGPAGPVTSWSWR